MMSTVSNQLWKTDLASLITRAGLVIRSSPESSPFLIHCSLGKRTVMTPQDRLTTALLPEAKPSKKPGNDNWDKPSKISRGTDNPVPVEPKRPIKPFSQAKRPI